MKFLRNITFLFVVANLSLPVAACSAKISPYAKSCFSTLQACLSACWSWSTRSCRRSSSIAPAPAVMGLTSVRTEAVLSTPHVPDAGRGGTYEISQRPPTAEPLVASKPSAVSHVVPEHLTIVLTPPGAAEPISLKRPITFSMTTIKDKNNRQEISFEYRRDNESIARIRGEILDSHRGHIYGLYIHPDCQDQGYFKRLVEDMCNFLLGQKCTLVTVNPIPHKEASEDQFSRELAHLIRSYNDLHFSIEVFMPNPEDLMLSSSSTIPTDRSLITMKRDLLKHPPVKEESKEEKKA